jgi:DNA invertase Pin-like site-specific DNA recombinase
MQPAREPERVSKAWWLRSVWGRVGPLQHAQVSRSARNRGKSQQLIEVCRVVDTMLIDQETVYAPRLSVDRLLHGVKGNRNEDELDVLRQRLLDALREKARRSELVIMAPVGYRKGREHWG